jgi:hypothetical protein
MCRLFDIRGFRVSVEYGGEFDTISHRRGQDYGFDQAVKDLGFTVALKQLNEPWGGV